MTQTKTTKRTCAFGFSHDETPVAPTQKSAAGQANISNLLKACQRILVEFSEWEGPKEIERDSASISRNQKVEAYEALRIEVQKAEARQ